MLTGKLYFLRCSKSRDTGNFAQKKKKIYILTYILGKGETRDPINVGSSCFLENDIFAYKNFKKKNLYKIKASFCFLDILLLQGFIV